MYISKLVKDLLLIPNSKIHSFNLVCHKYHKSLKCRIVMRHVFKFFVMQLKLLSSFTEIVMWTLN